MLHVQQTDRRECVLSLVLEHGLIGFITACISQWSTAGDASLQLLCTSDFYTLLYMLSDVKYTKGMLYTADGPANSPDANCTGP